jgi:acyl carrier protein
MSSGFDLSTVEFHYREVKMSAVDNTEARIMEYLKAEVVLDDGAASLTPESPLLNGAVDSLGLTQLVAFLEEEFQIEVDDADIKEEHFSTVENISRLVSAKVATV